MDDLTWIVIAAIIGATIVSSVAILAPDHNDTKCSVAQIERK